jgi:hypothetical protein
MNPKPVALCRIGLMNKLYFFAATKFDHENKTVIGKEINPDESGDYYHFGEETVRNIDDFKTGFDYVFYGDCVGAFPVEYINEIIPRGFLTIRYQ